MYLLTKIRWFVFCVPLFASFFFFATNIKWDFERVDPNFRSFYFINIYTFAELRGAQNYWVWIVVDSENSINALYTNSDFVFWSFVSAKNLVLFGYHFIEHSHSRFVCKAINLSIFSEKLNKYYCKQFSQ